MNSRRAPRRQPRTGRSGQRGFSGVLVIVVLVLLGGISTYAVGLVTSVHSGYARELSHARATQAAEAGLDWGRYRISAGAAATCTAAQSINTLPGTLQPYTVTVRCTAGAALSEAGLPLRAYRITATGCSQPLAGACPNVVGGSDYVERTVATVVVR